ncbi:glycoside hydrolase family 6 protein [Aeromicrobium wangtongii]|uniref:glycoside hydrolase family 6 protein n=1 Tax=Aeromicrobium wangtongii TaxID=2969247 RepID=UPI002016D7EB|nr:glycoside hydrolase family 6 protein [Aeromicrobium wangtongii]MCL3817829.1 glycoside hydrolase family 6 protein [Aeromicrobium wangtongii]
MSGVRHGTRPLLLAVPVVLFVAVFVAARLLGQESGGGQDVNPFADRLPLATAGTAAAGAVPTVSGDDQRILERLAAVPQATWLTPEAHPVGQVGAFVAGLAEKGRATGRAPVLVVYGITDRDCSGGHSSGGLSPDAYRQWLERIAGSMGSDAVVVLEPDALATAPECGRVDQRTALIRDAVAVLADATVYIDAGHSNWIDPADMASMLSAAGVGDARGFSTNVAAYEPLDAEKSYAEALSAAVGGAHYVIDTGRNGAGSTGEWCNPSGRALGREPGPGDGGRLDAYLWIKPPGESDGTCGGGPAAGVFWTERALEMARAAGW